MSGLRLAAACLLLAAAPRLAAHAAGEPPGPTGIARCGAIPASRFQTGLVFNPTGMETFYERALCFQHLAADTRDLALCRHVAERRSWFFDGSGVSPGACKRAVERGTRDDKAAARLLREPQRVVSARIVRDGNGRDFDVRIQTSAGAGAGLRLTLSVIDPRGIERILRDAAQPMDDRPGALDIFVPATDVDAALGPATRDRTFILRTRLERSLQDPRDRRVHAHAPQLRLSSTIDTPFVPQDL